MLESIISPEEHKINDRNKLSTDCEHSNNINVFNYLLTTCSLDKPTASLSAAIWAVACMATLLNILWCLHHLNSFGSANFPYFDASLSVSHYPFLFVSLRCPGTIWDSFPDVSLHALLCHLQRHFWLIRSPLLLILWHAKSGSYMSSLRLTSTQACLYHHTLTLFLDLPCFCSMSSFTNKWPKSVFQECI